LGSLKFERDVVAIVETNVDDTTGEVLGRTIERLTLEGAFDVSVVQYTGKKGRVGQTVRVVCGTESVDRFAQILVEETGTLGVKFTEYQRLVVPRRKITIPVAIKNFRGDVHVKVSENRIKPDYDEVREIADKQNIPVRDAMDLVTTAGREYLSKTSSGKRKEEEN
jgi:uncharacterized protein (DUF111 family)